MLPRTLTHMIVAMACFVAGSWKSVCADGILEDVRDEVRNDDEDSGDSDSHRSHHRHSDCDDDDDPLSQIFAQAAFYALTSPWWHPVVAMEEKYPFDNVFYTPPYREEGFPLLAGGYPRPYDGERYSMRLSTAVGTNFDGLDRIRTRFVLDTSTRLGIDTEWDHWRENVGSGHDLLDVGDFNVVFRFAQSPELQFHSGIGFNWMTDEHDSDFGFNFTYGIDYFPRKPWILSTVFDLGKIGDATRFHVLSSAGVNWGPAEFFAGYDYSRIGSVNLQGPLVGLRLWF